MGAWGTAIFSDDMALDIRHEYNALANGRNLKCWKASANDKNYIKRAQVLEEFKNTILSPMPEKKKLKNTQFPNLHLQNTIMNVC